MFGGKASNILVLAPTCRFQNDTIVSQELQCPRQVAACLGNICRLLDEIKWMLVSKQQHVMLLNSNIHHATTCSPPSLGIVSIGKYSSPLKFFRLEYTKSATTNINTAKGATILHLTSVQRGANRVRTSAMMVRINCLKSSVICRSTIVKNHTMDSRMDRHNRYNEL